MDLAEKIKQAFSLYKRAEWTRAEPLLKEILQLQPDHPACNHALGLVLSKTGDYHKALEYLQRSIQISPDTAVFHFNLASTLLNRQETARARSHFESGLKLDPANCSARLLYCECLLALQEFDTAIRECTQGITQCGQKPRFNYLRAMAYLGLRFHQNAEQDFDLALAGGLEEQECFHHFCSLLLKTNRYKKMARLSEKALLLWPGTAAFWNFSGIACGALLQGNKAIAAFRKARTLAPDFVPAAVNLGAALLEEGNYSQARTCLEEALAYKPESDIGWNNLGTLYSGLGDRTAAESCFRKALAVNPRYALAHSNLVFLMASGTDFTTAEVLAQSRLWDRVQGESGRRYQLPSRSPQPSSGRRLKIGYLCGALTGVIGYFLEPLLSRHDREKFEIHCYVNGKPAQLGNSRRLSHHVDHWKPVTGLDNKDLARLIHEDGIDILVDLMGHVGENRLRVFTYRPAPVSVAYLGYFATTGLREMDYWLTDTTLHPEDTPEHSAETIIRLPRCWVAYQAPRSMPPVSLRPTNSGPVIFGVFLHNLAKLSPALIACWSRILNALPAGRLLFVSRPLQDPQQQHAMERQFYSHGVMANRLMLRGRVPLADYFALYGQIDILLDPFPRTGGTVTAESLWMGVPVVTLAGQRYMERISASKLHAAGLDDLIASTPEQYEQIATELARDPARRQYLRRHLRQRMQQSELGDHAGLARAVEAAYSRMWQEKCSKCSNRT